MDINKELDKIFNDDELNLLNVKPKTSNNCTADERLIRSFEEINEFIDNYDLLDIQNAYNILRCGYQSDLKKEDIENVLEKMNKE